MAMKAAKYALSRAGMAIRDRRVLALLGILALAAYLRLWNIHHLFNILHDFDEGAYSLGARFISQGYLPYQDFMLIHPPLYDFVLAAVYKVFGYSFFHGRYLSIALSLACVVLIYLIGKKMYHARAGLAAAALFAVAPMVVYLGRRAVQEMLGVLFILGAVYFAIDFIGGRRRRSLFFCGLAMGLALATKYLFVPAVAGIVVAIALLSLGEGFWQSLRALGRPALWLSYLCFAVVFYAVLLILRWGLWLPIAVPFLDSMGLTAGDVSVAALVFILPFFVSAALLGMKPPFRKWSLALWGLRRSKGLWVLMAGAAIGFLSVTGFFWLRMPQEFVHQTILLQQDRPLAEFPSVVGLIRLAPGNTDFLQLVCLPVLLVIPFLFLVLNKKQFSQSDCFLAVSLFVAFALCQLFPAMPRYFICLYPLLYLAISWLVLPVDVGMLVARLRAGLLVVSAIFLLFLSLSVALLSNYTGYGHTFGHVFSTHEERMYEETLDYLEGAGAKKIWATSPTFAAMSNSLESTLAFDSFALLFLEQKAPEEILNNLIDEGVEYVCWDSWAKWGEKASQVRDLRRRVQCNSQLVKVIEPDNMCRVEIYRLGAGAGGIFNGEFEQWVTDDGLRFPVGWDPVITRGLGDEAGVDEAYVAGRKCVGLTVYENGEQDGELDSTYAGIAQKMPFPESPIKVQVWPEVNTEPSERPELLRGIHFVDDGGRSVIVGFSDRVDGQEIFPYEEGYRMLVIEEAELCRWSEQTIDLAGYWSQAGWEQPDEISMVMVVSAHSDHPGRYHFYVARVE